MDITAREHADLLLAGLAQNGIVLNQFVRFVVNGFHVKKRPMVQTLFCRAVRNQVFLNRGTACNAVEHAVLRNERDTAVTQLLLREAEDALRAKCDATCVRRQEAKEHIDQFFLAITLDTCNAENFAPAHIEGYLIEHLFVPFIDVFYIAYTKHNIRRIRLILLHVQNDITADHQTRNFFLRYIASIVNTH